MHMRHQDLLDVRKRQHAFLHADDFKYTTRGRLMRKVLVPKHIAVSTIGDGTIRMQDFIDLDMVPLDDRRKLPPAASILGGPLGSW